MIKSNTANEIHFLDFIKQIYKEFRVRLKKITYERKMVVMFDMQAFTR